MSIQSLTTALQATALSQDVRSSSLYPFVEGTHVLSLALSVGMIIWFDLRLVGLVLRRDSIRTLYASLRPWMFLGFGLMVITGSLLFLSRPADVWATLYFRIKLSLLAACLINILIFHWFTAHDMSSWDTAERPPAAARAAGAVSILLWFSVVAFGRLVAYSI
jgi:hypothetical protein